VYLIGDIAVRPPDPLACPGVWTLIDDLDAFYLEHRRCGRLDTGVEDERVWMMCEWGALFGRVIKEAVGG